MSCDKTLNMGDNNGASEQKQYNCDEADTRPSPPKQEQESPSNQAVARMPVDLNPDYYNMNHTDRGMAIIFNHKNFELKLNPRTGTDVDSNMLIKVFTDLGFKPTVHTDLIMKDVFKYIKEAAQADHSNSDCIIICVLTHGELGILYAKDTHYNSDNLWDHFTEENCPTLAGKPKLFFIQACQGGKFDPGTTLCDKTERDGSKVNTNILHNTCKLTYKHRDFLIVNSTFPGYYSLRNTTQGSWFIQALAKDLQEYATKKDILTLLTFVSQKVAGHGTQKKQIPCITSMLTRLLVFGKKK